MSKKPAPRKKPAPKPKPKSAPKKPQKVQRKAATSPKPKGAARKLPLFLSFQKKAKKAPRKPRLKQQKGVSKKDAFLAAFKATASVTKAAEAVRIERGMHYRWLAEDTAYKQAFELAKDEAAQTLEDEAVRRAHQGTSRPVFYQGFECGQIQEYSDTLMIALLKAWRPDKYHERVSNEVTGPNGGPLNIAVRFVKPKRDGD